MIRTIDAQSVRSRVRELPKLPKAVHEITAAINDEDLCLDAFSQKIAIDPAMVAKVLRAANSPFYGMSGSIGSVQDAVRLIGLRTVGTLLTTTAVMHSIAPPSCRGFVFQRFWEHSLATAICAQELARSSGHSQTVAFTAGLIHDIGRLAMATYYPLELAEAIAYARQQDCTLIVAEQAVLGIGHAEVGGWIARHWNFADAVSTAIANHHGPVDEDGGEVTALTDIVHTADGIVHALDLHPLDGDMVPLLDLGAWRRLKIEPEGCQRIFERTQSGFEALRDALT
jgi:putative nucleotidyltransferase with HDIG domain